MDQLISARHHINTLWAYNQLGQPPRSADLLLVMGTNDIRVADHAAELAQKYDYKYIVCSGGVAHLNSLLKTDFGDTEANVFAARMIAAGVPEAQILREQRATNTGQNVTCTRALLAERGVNIRTGQLVQKPFMERRALATAQKQWPEIDWSVTSTGASFDDFIDGVDIDNLVNILVGDTVRMITYATAGFQTPQPMPDNVHVAVRALIDMGFSRHLPEGFDNTFLSKYL